MTVHIHNKIMFLEKILLNIHLAKNLTKHIKVLISILFYFNAFYIQKHSIKINKHKSMSLFKIY